MIQLVRYSTTRGALKQIQQYQLVNVMYTATPQQVIRACKSDLERTAVMIMNGNQLVGFFCLHCSNLTSWCECNFEETS
ncbi:hypothetical protein ACH5A9_07170 [Lactiplantibacillus plantarum]|uniref:hypothetical protein n=1 Tax=Lactiplantibacillus plantarum TaxID=1590 RepID=UPI0037CCBB3C